MLPPVVIEVEPEGAGVASPNFQNNSNPCWHARQSPSARKRLIGGGLSGFDAVIRHRWYRAFQPKVCRSLFFEVMGNAHRPFWVLRHRITGQTKVVPNPDGEDSMWQVCLTDGSDAAVVTYETPKARFR